MQKRYGATGDYCPPEAAGRKRSTLSEEIVELLGQLAQFFGAVTPFGRERALRTALLDGLGSLERNRQGRSAGPVDRERGGHEVSPDVGGNRAAAKLAERLVVGPANPP